MPVRQLGLTLSWEGEGGPGFKGEEDHSREAWRARLVDKCLPRCAGTFSDVQELPPAIAVPSTAPPHFHSLGPYGGGRSSLGSVGP